MSDYTKVCALSALRLNRPHYLSVNSRHVILVLMPDLTGQVAKPPRVLATSALCPHQMADMTYGYVEDDCITCPMHHYRFDLSTGDCLEDNFPNLRLNTYPVRIEDGQVWVAVEPPAWMA
jgi:nitrite reductase/ring-hydroxylating ferredoxin subunit